MLKKLCSCGKPAISGGVVLCQYHWDKAISGKLWADHCLHMATGVAFDPGCEQCKMNAGNQEEE